MHRKPLRQIGLTREGWLFMVILGFITVGAVLRNVNLLILMAGLMYAPLFINWRLGVLRLRTLKAKRSLLSRIHAGELIGIQWICDNRSRITAWNVEIRDTVYREKSDRRPGDLRAGDLGSGDLRTGDRRSGDRRSGDRRSGETEPAKGWRIWRWLIWMLKLDKAPRNNAKVSMVQVGPGQSEVAAYRVFFADRGKYLVGPATLSTSFPFGLIRSTIQIPGQQTFHVAPSIGELSPVWEQRVRSSVVGSDAIKRKRGLDEDEFYALRPWRSGDSKKHIHWRTSARFGQPIVKQHDQQDNRDFAILLDLFEASPDLTHSAGQESSEVSAPENHCEEALRFGATVLLRVGNAVQGRIAMAVCGEQSVVCRSRNQREIVNQAMKELAIAQSSPGPKIIDSLLKISASVSASTPLYVFSTRPIPEGFDHETVFSQEFGTADTPESNRLKRQLKTIWSSIRWISVDSDEFRSMFNRETQKDNAALSALAERWNKDHATS